MYAFSCVLICANMYYFHENCFLTPLILWLFVFLESDKKCIWLIPMFMLLSVKEDASIYVFFTGLYYIFSSDKRKNKNERAILLMCFSVLYFIITSLLMGKYGEGIMSNRYDNYIFGNEKGLIQVILSIIKNPLLVLKNLITAKKAEFLVYMLIPFCGLPLVIKKPARIILLLPMVLMNLMSDYVYQYDINFQYTYGSSAFLFVLLVFALGELDGMTIRKLLFCGVCFSLFAFSSACMGKCYKSVVRYNDTKDEIEIISQALDTIPEDKSVSASTYLCPALYKHKILYENYYTKNKADYLVLDFRFENNKENIEKAISQGYKEIYISPNLISIYKYEPKE